MDLSELERHLNTPNVNAVSGSVMDVKGSGDLRPGKGDPDHYMRVVAKRPA